jgi:hypothetical protein
MSKQVKMFAIIGGVLIAGAVAFFVVGGKTPGEQTQERGYTPH